MLRREEIQIRDPFVLPDKTEKLYYMYGTTVTNGFDVYVSGDLEHWEGPYPAFRPDIQFWADRDFWAPEVHKYQGKYYMFATFKAENKCRATQILISDNPKGPFTPHGNGPVTPQDWECLDGTLYMDNEETPWLVFCHEWLQVGDGEICAVKLTRDLTAAAGKPILLFQASEADWVKEIRGEHDYVTDGPFLYKNGEELRMLWSSIGHKGYALSTVFSVSGKIEGPWVQEIQPFFTKDGGHGMLFETFEGEQMLVLHQPNSAPDERAVFLNTRSLGLT